MKTTINILLILLLSMPVIAQIGCSRIKNVTESNDTIKSINSIEHFNSIIEHSGNRLIAFDLYADWCMPCHVLAPILDQIAREHRSKVTIFKVNTYDYPQITEAFGATGIPFVIFIKNRKAIYALMGVQPKESYIKIINSYADTTSNIKTTPDEKKIEGVPINSPHFHQIRSALQTINFLTGN